MSKASAVKVRNVMNPLLWLNAVGANPELGGFSGEAPIATLSDAPAVMLPSQEMDDE